jgi:RHS repeat-associated protein
MPHSPAENQTSSRSIRTVLLATNDQNSIIAELAGGQLNSIAYCAYGEHSAQQEVATSLGFNGELRETPIGWYLLGKGYRAYNPRLMRFHSPDSWSPFGSGGLNAYIFCTGDPVNFSDPTGHSIFGVVRDFYSRNISLSGGSQASINARHSRSMSAGIKRDEARYELGQAGGAPSATAASSQSSALASIGALVLGAPGPRGNNNPAIGNIGTTTVKHHEGYVAGAQRDGLTTLANRSTASTTSHTPNMPLRASTPDTQRQGMRRDSKGIIWVTFRDGNGKVVRRPHQPVRGGGDATGTRPRTGMDGTRSAEPAFVQLRQQAFVAALDVRTAELRQAGLSRQEIVGVLRREGPAIARGVNARFR